METKEIKINVPEGYEIDQENSTFECIKFKPVKKKFPKTWKEFCKTHPRKASEYYSNENSEVFSFHGTVGLPRDPDSDKNILPSKELAEAMLALCQLIQLRDCYNDGWTLNWSKNSSDKYAIYPSDNEIVTSIFQSSSRILAFKTKELRDQFLENFRDLIEIAKPLL